MATTESNILTDKQTLYNDFSLSNSVRQCMANAASDLADIYPKTKSRRNKNGINQVSHQDILHPKNFQKHQRSNLRLPMGREPLVPTTKHTPYNSKTRFGTYYIS